MYNGIRTFDYDAVTAKTAPATLSLEPLLKSMRTMRDKRVDLPRERTVVRMYYDLFRINTKPEKWSK